MKLRVNVHACVRACGRVRGRAGHPSFLWISTTRRTHLALEARARHVLAKLALRRRRQVTDQHGAHVAKRCEVYRRKCERAGDVSPSRASLDALHRLVPRGSTYLAPGSWLPLVFDAKVAKVRLIAGRNLGYAIALLRGRERGVGGGVSGVAMVAWCGVGGIGAEHASSPFPSHLVSTHLLVNGDVAPVAVQNLVGVCPAAVKADCTGVLRVVRHLIYKEVVQRLHL